MLHLDAALTFYTYIVFRLHLQSVAVNGLWLWLWLSHFIKAPSALRRTIYWVSSIKLSPSLRCGHNKAWLALCRTEWSNFNLLGVVKHQQQQASSAGSRGSLLSQGSQKFLQQPKCSGRCRPPLGQVLCLINKGKGKVRVMGTAEGKRKGKVGNEERVTG